MFRFAQQAEFANQMLKLKEMRTQKEEELEGGWYTEERMEKDLGYSKFLAVPNICCLWPGVLGSMLTSVVSWSFEAAGEQGEGLLFALQECLVQEN